MITQSQNFATGAMPSAWRAQHFRHAWPVILQLIDTLCTNPVHACVAMAFLKIPILFSAELATIHAKFAPAKQVVSLVILADPFPQVEDSACVILELLITPPPKPAQLVLTLVFRALQVPLHVLHAIPPSGISFLLRFLNASAKLEHFRTELHAIHA